jgi:hypothetical protein
MTHISLPLSLGERMNPAGLSIIAKDQCNLDDNENVIYILEDEQDSREVNRDYNEVEIKQ